MHHVHLTLPFSCRGRQRRADGGGGLDGPLQGRVRRGLPPLRHRRSLCVPRLPLLSLCKAPVRQSSHAVGRSAPLPHSGVDRSFKKIGEAPDEGTVYNEAQLGVFFATVPRDSFTVASKFMPVGKADSSYETVKATLTASLARLGLEYVDLYYSHRVLSRAQAVEFVTSCKKLQEEGLLKNIGLSEVSADDLRAAHAAAPVCCIQQEWSLLTRGAEEDLVPLCKELNIGIVVAIRIQIDELCI